MNGIIGINKCVIMPKSHTYDYSSRGAYFMTICVKDRHELLGKNIVGDAAHIVPYGSPLRGLHNMPKIVPNILTKEQWVILAFISAGFPIFSVVYNFSVETITLICQASLHI
ncbi:MAG: hypothetical protein RR232_08670 [Clostridia bacterium]